MRRFEYRSDSLDDGPVVRTYEDDRMDALHQTFESKRRDLNSVIKVMDIKNVTFKWANVQSITSGERMRGVLELIWTFYGRCAASSCGAWCGETYFY